MPPQQMLISHQTAGASLRPTGLVRSHMPHQALCQIKIFAPFWGFLLCSHLSISFFEGFCGGVGEFFAPRGQKRGDVRERPLCGMQRTLRMCPVLGCAETASLPVANIAASQNASKTRFAMRDAKTATGKRRRLLSKRASSPSKGRFCKSALLLLPLFLPDQSKFEKMSNILL